MWEDLLLCFWGKARLFRKQKLNREKNLDRLVLLLWGMRIIRYKKEKGE